MSGTLISGCFNGQYEEGSNDCKQGDFFPRYQKFMLEYTNVLRQNLIVLATLGSLIILLLRKSLWQDYMRCSLFFVTALVQTVQQGHLNRPR